MQVRIAIRQEAHFERLGQVVDALRAVEQRRHHHQRARLAGDAERIVHARQHARHDDQRDHPVDQRHRQLAGGEQQQQRQRQRLPPAQAERLDGGVQRAGRQGQREQQHRAAVGRQRIAAEAALQRIAPRQPHPDRRFQALAARPDQVVADMAETLVAAGSGTGGGRQRDGLPGDLDLRRPRQPRHPLDRMAVAVAGGEVHLRMNAGRVAAQRLLDARQRLDEIAPVHRAEQAQAADAVGHRHLVGRLLLALGMHPLLDRRAAFAEALLQPGQRQRERRALALQPARELGHEGARQRRLGARHVGDEQDQLARRLLGRLQHAGGPGRGEVAVDAAGGDERADAAQVLDQRQPEHDRHRPQLAEQQRLHRLVGGDEARQRAARQPGVGVRDHLQRERIDARLAGLRRMRRGAADRAAPVAGGRRGGIVDRGRRQRIADQPRQLAAVAPGQVAPGGAHLLLDQVEVVEQPFGGRRHAPFGGRGAGELSVDAGQHALVVGQPGEQPVGQRPVGDAVGGRQPLGMLRHLVGAVELGAQRLVVAGQLAVSRLRPQPAEPALGGMREGRGDVG